MGYYKNDGFVLDWAVIFLGIRNFKKIMAKISCLDLKGSGKKDVSCFHVYRFGVFIFSFMGDHRMRWEYRCLEIVQSLFRACLSSPHTQLLTISDTTWIMADRWSHKTTPISNYSVIFSWDLILLPFNKQ